MAISASYIDAHTIVLTGDYIHSLAPGMAIRTDCGVDGIIVVKVKWMEYKGGKTIIYVIPSESTDITGNLQTVDFSCIKPTNQRHMGNFGNIPIDWVFAYRGFRRAGHMFWNTWDSFTLKSGIFHYYNYDTDRECLITLESDVVWTGWNAAGLTTSVWYYIYLNHLDENSNIISPATTSFTVSSTAPSFDSARFKWYHPTNYMNCLWFFESAGTSGVHPFFWHPFFYQVCRYSWTRQEYRWTGSYVQNIGVDTPLTIPSSFKIFHHFEQLHFWGYYVENYMYNRAYNWNSPNSWMCRHTHQGSYGSGSADNYSFFLPVDNNKLITLYYNQDDNSSYASYMKHQSRGFYLPIGFIET
jgi:hypothetical protein